MTLEEIIKSADLDAIIKVIDDRLCDYDGACFQYEEDYPGEMEKDISKELYYRHGFRSDLYDGLELLRKLKDKVTQTNDL
jgi:hypothetical protein